MEFEEVLKGGNWTPVVRVGDTVRRAAKPQTETVHALLNHLVAHGFSGCPQPRGFDGLGREVLEFIPGTVPWPIVAEFVSALGSDPAIARVARLIREYHDVVVGWEPPSGAVWGAPPRVDDAPVELICHNDIAPWNLVVSAERWSVIDWDVAGPGTRLEDLAYAALSFVPLGPSHATDAEISHRLRVFTDAYGLSSSDVPKLLDLGILQADAIGARHEAERLLPEWESHAAAWRGIARQVRQKRARWLT